MNHREENMLAALEVLHSIPHLDVMVLISTVAIVVCYAGCKEGFSELFRNW